jgi:Mg-chelatase subunit ChlD
MTAIKQSIDAMMDYLDDINSTDHVALASYDTVARLELDLTTDLAAVKARMHYLQAGHYSGGTNIGAGIRQAREILTGASARQSAHKVIVVLTDGWATRSDEGYSPDEYALYQAQLAADQSITIHAVSFTDFGDQSLMAQIAAIGGGVHFHVPSYSIEQYTSELQEVFLKLSSHRRAMLTQ